MDIKLSDYLTTSSYRRNSASMYDDLLSLRTPRPLPTWWRGWKPKAKGFWGVVTAPVTYPSYWTARAIGKMQTAGIEAHKTNLGVPSNEILTNDRVKAIAASRMMNRIHNAHIFLGNEALYKHK